MISPLLPGLSGTQTGAAELAGSPLTPAQAIKLGREQGRLLLEASSTPARMPALQSGETLLAQVSERLPDGKLAAQIKGEPFILTVPQDGKVEGEALRLRVATTQPLSFFLLDGDDLKPLPSPADQIASRQSQALANAMQLAASSEGVALETLSQPTGKMPAFQTGEWVMAKVAERLPDGSAAVLVKNAAFTMARHCAPTRYCCACAAPSRYSAFSKWTCRRRRKPTSRPPSRSAPHHAICPACSPLPVAILRPTRALARACSPSCHPAWRASSPPAAAR
jgi:hypothetical protein